MFDQSSHKHVKTLRLNEDDVEGLLEYLDDDSGNPNRSGANCYPYRVKTLVIHLKQPGDASYVPYMVATRYLSAYTLSFLHGGYIHVGSSCKIQLISLHGTWTDVDAKVTSCQYIKQNVHDVTVRFAYKIDVSEFCHSAVHNRVLLVEDDATSAKLAMFFMKQLNCEVNHVTGGQQAVTEALKNNYDVILMDIEMPGMDGLQATKKLRDKGYNEYIVAITSLTGPGDQEKCLKAGCNKYIAKPYTHETLSIILESLNEEPLFSSLGEDPAIRQVINAFVAELPAKVRELEEAINQEDIEKVEFCARHLKGEAGGYGFEAIAESAKEVESSLQKGDTLRKIMDKTNALIKLCSQARGWGY